LRKYKKLMVFLILFILFSIINTNVYADTAYKTYTEDQNSDYVETQTAYMPVQTITKVGSINLNAPSDIKIGANGYLYIADTGNKRVIVATKDGNLINTIGNGILSKPVGLFVTKDNMIYVADEAKKCVFAFANNGNLIKKFSKPNAPLFGNDVFIPEKVAVDDRGDIFMVSKGNTNGLIQLSQSGSFLGYFGANSANVNLLTIFQKAIFTQYQLSRMLKTVPPSITNIAIDKEGLIYTISQGTQVSPLKKLNFQGTNIIHADLNDKYPTAVTVGPYKNVFVASQNGFIYEYTKEGNLLFVFGGQDDGSQRRGLFNSVSGIDVDKNGYLYVIDSGLNKIEVFKPTEFADLVHNALQLYQNGEYKKSKGPWMEVLKMNSLFNFANIGMGDALYWEGDYRGALNYYGLANYKEGYSDAFWEVRNEWMRKYFVYAVFYFITFIVLVWLIKKCNKKYGILKPIKKFKNILDNIKLLREVSFIFKFIKHPIDGYYGIKRENKTSYLSSSIVLFIFFIIYILNKYETGYIFRTVKIGQYDLLSDIYYVFGVFFLIVICNYLVTTINDGDGTFKDIYSGFTYSLAPYILLKPFVILLSNVLTFNESFIFSFANFVIYAWVLILVIVMIKEINDFSLGETFKVIFLTLFTMLIVTLVLFVLYVLISQLVDFITSVYREAVYRVENSK